MFIFICLFFLINLDSQILIINEIFKKITVSCYGVVLHIKKKEKIAINLMSYT